MSNKSDDLSSNSEKFYQSWLFSSAYNLYKIDSCAVRDYVWRYFSLLREAGDGGDFSVPSDFDPVGYMLLNPDIVYAGVNPYSHYTEYGCLEGRQYAINLPQNDSVATLEVNPVNLLLQTDPVDECSWEASEAGRADSLENTVQKKIIFHVGGPKTGSSALQEFLEINFEHLEEYGFSYEKNNILANGYLLYDILRANIATDEQLDHAILSYLGRAQNSICSSEMLSVLNESEWSRIHQSCNRLNIDYIIIIYIRDLVPFFYSAYNQHVKMGVECRSIYEFSLTFPWMHSDSLRTLHNCIEANRIKVFLYESLSVNIVQHFLNAIGIGEFIELGNINLVNRSLTPVELKFRRGLNKCLGRQYSAALSDCLIHSRPNLQVSSKYDRSVIFLLKQRFQNDIEWINKTFFDHDVVGLLTDLNTPVQTQQQQADESLPVLKTLCQCIADMTLFDNIRDRVFHFSASILPLTSYASSYGNDIPSDFNPVDYLLLNPDVVYAGENAYAHYLSYGISEGRDYKFICEKVGQSATDLVFDDWVVSRPLGTLSIATSLLSMTPNERAVLDVSITNNGQECWVGGLFRTVNLSYHWLDAEWNMVVYEGERTSLPTGGVPSGQTVLANMTVMAPPDVGDYHLFLTLVQEYEGWFDNMGEGFQPAILNIEVG